MEPNLEIFAEIEIFAKVRIPARLARLAHAQAEGEAADDSGAGAMAAREEWFARAAAVGRACMAASCDLLARLIADRQAALQRCAAAGERGPACWSLTLKSPNDLALQRRSQAPAGCWRRPA
jgi:hypothetical protein